jgi:GNAT superfamily N-acetyltransferase
MNIVKGVNFCKGGFEDQVAIIDRAEQRREPEFLGSKDGLDLYYITSNCREHFIYLKHEDDYIGMISLHGRKKNKLGFGVGAVYISPKFRGRGLGTVLYLGAIHRLKRIHSSTCIGEQAVRTWRSLAKYHDLKIYDLYDEDTPKEYTWETKRKYPLIDGKRLDQGWDYYQFCIDITKPKKKKNKKAA